jgi:hypothetical protein
MTCATPFMGRSLGTVQVRLGTAAVIENLGED